jgi:hypothetical protein
LEEQVREHVSNIAGHGALWATISE